MAFIRFADSLNVSILYPIIVLIGLELGLSVSYSAALASLYPATLLLSAPIFGLVSDKIGRRLPLIAGSALILAANIIGAVAFGVVGVILSRLISGIGAGQSSVCGAILVDLSDEKTLSKNLMIRQASFTAGVIAGPAIALGFAETGLRFAFLVLTIFSALSFFASLFVQETLQVSRERVQPSAGADTNDAGPMITRRVFGPLCLVIFFVSAAYTCVHAVFPLVAASSLAQPYKLQDLTTSAVDRLEVARLAGASMLLVAVVSLVAQLILSRQVATARWKSRVLALLVIWAIGFAAAPALLALGYIWFAMALIVEGVCSGLFFVAIGYAVADLSKPTDLGKNFGIMESTIYFALVVAPLASGTIYLHLGNAIFFVASALLILAALVMSYLLWSAPRIAEAQLCRHQGTG